MLLHGFLSSAAFARTVRTAVVVAFAAVSCVSSASASDAPAAMRRSITELKPTATIHLGKSADWVATTADAVWVGSTGPNAVHQIDPRTNARVATVQLPGNPCAGLAVGFESLWVPLCGKPNTLARVNLKTRAMTVVPGLGPAASEGGITTSPDSVWLVVDAQASLARIDPATGKVRQTIHLPAGSYNPLYADGQVWVTRADGAEVTVIDAETGAISATVHGGAHPRFLTAGAGAVWTLNQRDGSLTRIDMHTRQVTKTIALGTPGRGGDISFGAGMIWTSFRKAPLSVIDAASASLVCQWTGPGGDALGIGHGAIWLTDFDAGTISRIQVKDALAHCKGSSFH